MQSRVPCSPRALGLECVKMIKCLKAGSGVNEILRIGRKPSPRRSLSTTPILQINTTLNISASATKPEVTSHIDRNKTVFRAKSAGLFPRCRQASGDASTGYGTLNRTALHELHIKNGGKMVPFGGYSMPVQYSDLGVGESHLWTREKASLFDVGHM